MKTRRRNSSRSATGCPGSRRSSPETNAWSASFGQRRCSRCSAPLRSSTAHPAYLAGAAPSASTGSPERRTRRSRYYLESARRAAPVRARGERVKPPCGVVLPESLPNRVADQCRSCPTARRPLRPGPLQHRGGPMKRPLDVQRGAARGVRGPAGARRIGMRRAPPELHRGQARGPLRRGMHRP